MKKFLLFFILFAIVASAAYILISSYTYSDGTRNGYLMKFSTKGLMFKTHEGEVNLGYINTAGGKFSSNTWNFSVLPKHQDLIDSLAVNEGSEMRFYYKEKLNNLPWQGDTKYFVYKVELLKNQAAKEGMRNF